MKKLTKSVGIATAVLIALGVVTAAPASAAKSECALTYACGWDTTYFGGDRVAFQERMPSFGAVGMNDRITSLYNHGRYQEARFYVDSYYGGSYLTLSVSEDITGLGATWNNKLSSGQFWRP